MNAPLPIAYVIGQLGYGGAERQLYECASHLDRSEFQPVVYSLTPEIEPYGRLLREQGIEVVALARRRRGDFLRAIELGRLLKRQGAALVHSFLAMDGITTTLACRSFARSAVPILSARCVSERRDRLREGMIGMSYRRARLVVCNAAEVARFVVGSYGVDPERIRVVYNGIRVGRFAACASRVFAGHATTVGIMCRLEPAKNVELFLRAAALLARRHSDLRFVVAGDGSAREGLVRLARELGISRVVHFAGMCDDVAAVLAGFDILVHTSNHEGFSNSLLEAMAAGLPVVTTRVGGAAELICDGHTGLLVRPGALEEVVAAVERLLADATLRVALGRSAAERVRRNFSVERMVEGMVKVYREALGMEGMRRESAEDSGSRDRPRGAAAAGGLASFGS